MHERLSIPFRLAAGAAALACCASAGAVQRNVLVTIENLAATNSISFAPLHVAFNNGSFDAFNEGTAAGPEIISVAELGAGSEWQSAFAMADPTAVRGVLDVPFPLLPGASGSKLFSLIDTTINPFFTFAAMVLPSNDHFIGNDSPMQHRLFDAAGNLAITSIKLMASDIWDAGSEGFETAKAAFVAGSDATLRNTGDGSVRFDSAGLASFDGVKTGAGYTFASGFDPNMDSDVYRISFTAVPEPESLALMLPGLLAAGWVGRQRRKARAEGADLVLATA